VSGKLIAGSGRSEHDGGGGGALVEVFERFTDRDVDQEIAQVRREKEAAIDALDFEAAAALRDTEKELLTARADREKERVTADRPSLTAEFKQVNAELERMRAILRQRGLDTDNGAA
jgi:excinuclease UvrABC nuclease subunit